MNMHMLNCQIRDHDGNMVRPLKVKLLRCCALILRLKAQDHVRSVSRSSQTNGREEISRRPGSAWQVESTDHWRQRTSHARRHGM